MLGLGIRVLEIYYGEDDYSRKRAIDALREQLGDPEMASLNAVTLNATDTTPAEVIAQAGAVPFLASGRLVVVEGLLAVFARSQGGGGSRGGGRASRSRQAALDDSQQQSPDPFRGWGQLKEVAPSLPESNILVLSDANATDSNPLLKHLAPVANVRVFAPLRGNDLTNWIGRSVQERGGKMDGAAQRALGDAHGSNLWALSNEIDKLMLYAGPDRSITVEDVTTMTAATREENIFAMVDDVIERRYPRARERIERLRSDTGAAVPQIMAMLGTQVRRLLAAKDATDRHVSQAELQDAIGSRSDFAIRKTVNQSRSFTMPRLREMHRAILDYDIALKTGQLNEDTAMELLIADLCGVGATGRR